MDALRTYLQDNDLGLEDVATATRRSYSAVKKWGVTRPYPPSVLPVIELWTGGAVTGRMLRPDLFVLEAREAA